MSMENQPQFGDRKKKPIVPKPVAPVVPPAPPAPPK